MGNVEKNSPEPAEPPAVAPAPGTDAALAAELGVAVEVVAELRAGYCASDVVDVGGVPVLSAAGIKKIRGLIDAHMRSEKAQARAVSLRKVATCTLPTEDLRITRVFKGSPRVLVQLPNGNETVLQVKTAEFLEAGMVLAGCVQGDMGWYYHGRLPRVIGEKQFYFPTKKAVPKGRPR